MRAALCLLLVGCTPGVVHDHLDVLVDDAMLPVAVHGNIGSGTLVVVESGGPSGPGIAERAIGYHPFQDTLEPSVAVAWYDRRGTGNATGDYAVEDQSMARLISDLDAVIATLETRYEPEHVVLLGHSFGTYSSGLYQLEHPGVVDGWVVAGPSFIEGPDELFISYRRDFACRVASDQIASGASDPFWDEIEAFCVANPTIPPVWDTPEREQLWEYLNEIEDRLEPWPSIEIGGVLGLAFGSHYNLFDTQLRENLISPMIEADPGREDLLPEIGAIDVPVAVATGEFDGTTPTEMGTALVEAVGPNATLTDFPGGGHYMMTDDPERFGEVVLSLVDQL